LVGEVYDFDREGASLSAILTSSANDWARIFRITWPRWTFTVASLSPTPRQSACRRPALTSIITSHLRGVYLSKPARSSAKAFPFAWDVEIAWGLDEVGLVLLLRAGAGCRGNPSSEPRHAPMP
jgi:hypothetical protein